MRRRFGMPSCRKTAFDSCPGSMPPSPNIRLTARIMAGELRKFSVRVNDRFADCFA